MGMGRSKKSLVIMKEVLLRMVGAGAWLRGTKFENDNT